MSHTITVRITDESYEDLVCGFGAKRLVDDEWDVINKEAYVDIAVSSFKEFFNQNEMPDPIDDPEAFTEFAEEYDPQYWMDDYIVHLSDSSIVFDAYLQALRSGVTRIRIIPGLPY